MKKSQRLRLAALLAKDSAALNAEENAELSSLQALAGQHPDASKDEDDTAPAAAAASETPAAVAAPTTLATILAGVADRVRSRSAVANDLAAARAQVAQLTTERDHARAELGTMLTQLAADQASLAAARAQLGVFCSFVGIQPAALAGKSDADTRAAIETAINAAATEKLGSLGVPQADLPAPTTEAAADKADLIKQFNAITDPNERAAFYAKHKADLFGAN